MAMMAIRSFVYVLVLSCLLPSSLVTTTGTPQKHISFTGRRKVPDFQQVITTEQDPESVYQARLNSIRNISEFASMFNLNNNEPSISSRVGSNAQELSQAGCIPELTAVPLDLPPAQGVTYFPTCVRVERCGGCCFASHHSCQPTAVQSIFVKVINVQEDVTTSSRRRRARNAVPNYISVEVERHLECGCDCRLQTDQCNLAIHDYNSHYCQCTCKNGDEETACLSSSEHYWNNNQCRCLCRNPFNCSSGLVFDHRTCSCVHNSASNTLVFDY